MKMIVYHEVFSLAFLSLFRLTCSGSEGCDRFIQMSPRIIQHVPAAHFHETASPNSTIPESPDRRKFAAELTATASAVVLLTFRVLVKNSHISELERNIIPKQAARIHGASCEQGATKSMSYLSPILIHMFIMSLSLRANLPNRDAKHANTPACTP